MYSLTKEWHSKPYPFISPQRPELSARGKTVVVTGGGTGIGKAVAAAFAQAGADVWIVGRRSDALESARAEVGNVQAIAIDLLDKHATTEAFRSIGQIDILVSNAGAYVNAGNMATCEPEDLLQSLEMNVVTTLHAIQAFIPLAALDAKLIHTTSDMACMPAKDGWLGSGAYAIGKAATLKLFEYVAAENPQLHVVNVQPGWIPTEMTGFTSAAPDSGRRTNPLLY